MINPSGRILVLFFFLFAKTATARPLPDPKDDSFIFTNARIYTVNSDQPWANTIAVRDGVITAIGRRKQVITTDNLDLPRFNLGGRMILPGLHDVHIHAVEAGINQDLCIFPEVATFARYQRVASRCAEEQADSSWVVGAGVFVGDLVNRLQLPIDILSIAIPDRPALIIDNLGHGAWVNAKALEEVGIDVNTPNPQGGILHRGSRTGQLSGIVFENAQQPFRDAAFPATVANINSAYDKLLVALERLNRNGITSISDAGGYWTRGHHQVWARAVSDNTLTVRASNALYVFPDRDFDDQIETLTDLFSNDSSSLLRFNQAKIYTDGILDLGTSALVRPYRRLPVQGISSSTGFQYFETATLNRYVQTLTGLGFQIHFHATGDRGVRLALDAVASLDNPSAGRHRITHNYLINRRDQRRFAELGVIADFQFSPGAIAEEYVEELQTFIGSRARRLLPSRPLYRRDATVVVSSDWDADPLPPFRNLSRALDNRKVPNLRAAVRAMTIDAAHLLNQESTTGSLEVGKAADMIVVNQNIFRRPRPDLSATTVLMTLLNGKVVYQQN